MLLNMVKEQGFNMVIHILTVNVMKLENMETFVKSSIVISFKERKVNNPNYD